MSAKTALDKDYAKAGFGNRLGFGVKPALAIVDFCNAYVERDAPLYCGAHVEDARAATAKLLKAARAARAPIFHTRVAFMKGGADGGVFFRKVKALKIFENGANAHLQDYAPGLSPKPNETIVTKQYASAFFGTSLGAALTALRVDTLIIAGVSTSGCVRATALDACQHGFIPIVVREAVADRDAAVHEANLFDINAKYGDVVSLSEALEQLKK
jgi:nicotinamidase-related amidase